MSGEGFPRAYSFDDVILLPGRSRVEPWQVDITGKAARNVELRVPLLAAPMDTVSEWRMGVALALRGAMAVIHRNMSREEQLQHVEKVKNHPIVELTDVYVRPGDECCRVLEYLRGVGVRDAPLVGYGGSVKGYVRLADLIECRCGEPVEKYLSPGKLYDVSDVDEALRVLRRGIADTLAITASGRYVGTLTLYEALKRYEPLLDPEGRLRVAAAVSPFDTERARMLDGKADVLVTDVAHFHNDNVIAAARRLSSLLSSDFVVGNIGTAEAATDVVSEIEKVDGFRVGIAGGNICTTSGVAGVAAPTLFAVMEVRRGLQEMGVDLWDVPIIADGGIRGSGDAVKALAAGAAAVMAGFLLAGTEEAAAPPIRIGGRVFKPYRGMASRGAMERRFAVDRYSRVAKRVEEGIEGLVEYRGPVERVIEEFAEGLRAGLGYAGAASIRELWARVRFAELGSRIGAFTGTVRTQL